MRQDISGSIGCVARDDERIEQYVVAEHDEAECDQPGDSRDFRGGALCVIDRARCHLFLQTDDDFASRVTCFQVSKSISGLIQFVSLVDDWRHLSGLQ